MTLNGIPKIKDDGGDYIVLTYYGTEGLAVSHQAKSVQEAAKWMLTCGYSSPQVVVKLIHVNLQEQQ